MAPRSVGPLTVTVTTTAGLAAALKSAQPGETIALAPGTYSGLGTYSGQAFNNLNFGTPVTITSQNSAKPAVLTSFNISNSSGLIFSNVELLTTGTTDPFPFRVMNSKNIQYSNVNVHGSLANNSANNNSGLYIEKSVGISVINSQFSGLNRGMVLSNDAQISVAGNSFHDIQSDGIDSAGTSNIQITGNAFTSFHAQAGDHPDAIQFWTSGTTESAQSITVSNNVITRGTGSPVQGIFMRDEVGTHPYQNVVIQNNVVTGALYNGIDIIHANNVTLSGNIVVGYSDQASWIGVQNSSKVLVNGNAASQYMMTSDTAVIQTNNITTKLLVTTPGTTLQSLLLSNSPLGAAMISHTSSLTAALLQMSR